MRAFVIDSIGDRGHVADVPPPEPEPGEILIRVTQVGLIASDWRVRGGSRVARFEHHFPAILGFDFAGEVVSGGGGWANGARVYGIAHKPFIGAGALAELLTMPTDGPIAPTPSYLTDQEAASLVSGWLTSLAVFDDVEIADGSVVVLLGASGGLGSVLTQLLAKRGARVVAVTRGANHSYVTALGAADVVAHDEVDVVEALRQRWPDGVDVLIDLISPAPRLRELATTVRNGGQVSSAVGAADLDSLREAGWRPSNIATKPAAVALESLATKWAADDLQLPEIQALSFDEIAEAIDRLEDGHVRGKLVVEVGRAETSHAAR